ncbi:MAG: hypothetical protein ACE5ER_02470 [Nitrospinaceae bacterium]
MADYRPLFHNESRRTRQFRRIIIRKTLRLVRDHPHLTDEEIIALAENEAVKICDLCVESSFDDAAEDRISQYFLIEAKGERKNHVGRLFLHPLEGHLRQGSLKECLIPVFGRSLIQLLGQERYDRYSQRMGVIVENAMRDGVVYREMLEGSPAQSLRKEILQVYREEMSASTGFVSQLKNQIDAALVEDHNENPQTDFNIDQAVEAAYLDFLRLMDWTINQD